MLDILTYDTFFAPGQVPWDIEWNGKDDCRLYTDHVAGELEIHTDIDRAIREKAGNTELPAFIAAPVNRLLNKRIWKKTGALPMNKKAEKDRVCI